MESSPETIDIGPAKQTAKLNKINVQPTAANVGILRTVAHSAIVRPIKSQDPFYLLQIYSPLTLSLILDKITVSLK